ncbi:hypothetical protein TSUD_300050 [Trifolium subterraneum]|uniref:RRM domain-containing protein n=1 Tax=Trifolium subterraneum TaxID=3900 RepID=A0A2Z6P884_TRISU|nr:hypothetical protein TSUD_300050 [Trifolium subterraneum]
MRDDKINQESNNQEVQDGEWTTVARRRRRDDMHGKDKTDKRTQLTSFYFMNFLDEVSIQDIRLRFSKFGDVDNISIHAKKNKFGKHFGFVRYKGFTEARDTEEKLRDVWFGTYKVWANVARFEKEGGSYRNFNRENQRSFSERGTTTGKDLKHKEALEKPRKTWKGRLRDEKGKRDWRGLTLETLEEDRAWAKKGLVGIVNHVDDVPSLQQKILDVGISTVKIIPMGGGKVFIHPVEDGDLRELIKDADEFFNLWFVKIKEWKPKETTLDRAVWIRVYGVPIHASKEEYFKLMVESLGEVIIVDEETYHKRRFDYARVLIRTLSSLYINQIDKVKIDESFFVIRILEESDTIIPIVSSNDLEKGEGHGSETDREKKRRRRVIPKMKDLARAQAKRLKMKKRKRSKMSTTDNGYTAPSESLNQEYPDAVSSNVWNYGSKEGVNFNADEGEAVNELEKIEFRDRAKSNNRDEIGNQSVGVERSS